jgi:hypothetical protein
MMDPPIAGCYGAGRLAAECDNRTSQWVVSRHSEPFFKRGSLWILRPKPVRLLLRFAVRVTCFTAQPIHGCHSSLEAVHRQLAALQEGEMGALEHLSIMVALLLAMAAALISSDAEARREITGFFAQMLRPPAADLGGDPGYLSGVATDTSRSR